MSNSCKNCESLRKSVEILEEIVETSFAKIARIEKENEALRSVLARCYDISLKKEGGE